MANILDEMERALYTELGTIGSFSVCKTYDDAPNPSLRIQDVGIVGVPLSTRDAEAIKAKAEQAPFGVRERTIIDTDVRDTWEIDASTVFTTNPRWKPFIENALVEACEEMGVNMITSRPRFDPYKLLLYEKGSHFLPYVDTEKADCMFATMIVVLPSEFEGGEACLSHAGSHVTYDCSKNSLHTTTVMTWYADVVHEIKPLTSGYRLALSYNLMHVSTSLRPALSDHSDFKENVRSALYSWRQSRHKTLAPQKILYLLEHQYTQSSLRGSALKGVDDVRVSMIRQMADDLRFHLGLATVNLVCHGHADDYPSYLHRLRHWGESGSGPDTDNVDFQEIETEEFSIIDFVDFEGVSISKSLEADIEDEVIPGNIVEEVQMGKYSSQEYYGHKANAAGSLSRTYRRTLLVIWPDYNDYDVAYRGEGFNYACHNLESRSLTSKKPTEDLLRLVDFILAPRVEPPIRSIRCVCCAAVHWKDGALWKRALGVRFWNNEGPLLDDTDLSSALEAFGFQEWHETLGLALATSPGNKSRLKLLTKLRDLLQKADDGPHVAWLHSQIAEALQNLKTPQLDDIELVIPLSHSHGGARFLEECIIPQIIEIANAPYLFCFAEAVTEFPGPEPAIKSKLVQELLVSAVSKANFMNKATEERLGSLNPNARDLRDGLARCLNLRCTDAVAAVLEKAKDLRGLTPKQINERSITVLLPVLEFLCDRLRGGPGVLPMQSLKSFAELTTSLCLEDIPGDKIYAVRVRSLVKIAILDDFRDLLGTILLPRVLLPQAGPDAQLVLAEELTALSERLGDHTEKAKLRTMVLSLANEYAYNVILYTPQSLIDALRILIRFRAAEACRRFVNRVIAFIASADATFFANDFDDSLILSLREFALSNTEIGDIGLNSAIGAITKRWASVVLGSKPPHNPSYYVAFQNWYCRCPTCLQTKVFLQDPRLESPTLSLERIGAQIKRHMEEVLTVFAFRVASFTTIHTYRGPQGLQICLTELAKLPLIWRRSQQKGLKMLSELASDEAQLRSILGEDYEGILSSLDVPRVWDTGEIPRVKVEPEESFIHQETDGGNEPPLKKVKTESG